MHLIPQSWSHLHILVSVFPSFGLVCVLGFYIAGLLTDNSVTKRTCLVLFALVALLSVPIYLSGAGSMSGNPGFSKAAMNTHYVWGIVALVALVLTGVGAVVALGLSGSAGRSEEHTSELQSHSDLVCRLLLEKKKTSAIGGLFRVSEA